MQEKEERRKQEELLRYQRLQEQEEQERLLAEQKRRELEMEKRRQMEMRQQMAEMKQKNQMEKAVLLAKVYILLIMLSFNTLVISQIKENYQTLITGQGSKAGTM